MFKSTRRILAGAVTAAAIVPSVASARPNVTPSPGAGAQVPAVPSVQPAAVSSAEAFQWEDAGIGAACMLAVVGVGSGVVLVRRRRAGHLLAG